MHRLRRFTSCIALIVIALLIAPAQKKPGDNRPLSGLDASAIPSYQTLQAFIQAHPNSSLVPASQAVDGTQQLAASAAMRSMGVQNSSSGDSQLKIYRRPNGSIGWLEGALTLPQEASSLSKQGATAVQRALALLASQSALLRINNPQEELVVINSTRDELSYEHVRFQQVYKGIPVWGRDFYVHFNAQGVAYLINGTYEPSPVGVETTPTTSPAAALQSVVNDLQARNRYQPLAKVAASRLGIKDPTEQLILYPMPQGELRLAYEVTIHPNLVEWYSYIVDAGDGKLLNRIVRHCTLYQQVESSRPIPSDTIKLSVPKASSGFTTGFTDATGWDLNGDSRQFRVWESDSGGYYMIWDLPSLDAEGSELPRLQLGGGCTSTYDADKFTRDLVSTDNTWRDPAAVSAHVNMARVYQYFKTTHNRNSLDADGGCIQSVVHYPYSSDVGPAAWTPYYGVFYTDGNDYITSPAGGLDLVGHEMTHAVAHSIGVLQGPGESAALYESFADVFGVLIDWTGRSDYLIGNDVMRAIGKLAIRDLENPKNPNVLSPAAATMAEYDSIKDKYFNMGIPNHVAYDIIDAIGKVKAERIYYRALTTKLTNNSTFSDCRMAVETSADELREAAGITDADDEAISLAFAGAGIEYPDLGSVRGTRGNEVPPVTGGKQHIAFIASSGHIGLCNPVTGQTTMFTSPNAVARTAAGDYSQVSTGLNGQKIWFINQSGQLANVDVVSGTLSSFPQVYIQKPGDLWNASVSPDEAYVSLISAYTGDSNLYMYDGKQVGKIPLDSTQGGLSVHSTQYPGAMSWPPNMNQPKIGFDAYHEVRMGDRNVGYWSIHEIDLTSMTIRDLVGPHPSNVSIGNITYGNTDPDLIAFNHADSAEARDVYAGSFDFGPVSALNLSSFKLGGTSVTDADQPTFSPNDSVICFTSTSRKSLLFYNRQSAQLTSLPLQMAVYSPRWFVQGGKVVSSTETGQTPTTFGLSQNYPNPFNPTTRIEYEVPARSQVKLTVYDLLGRLVRTLVNAEMQAGQFSTTWDGTDASGKPLSSGMYVYRLETRDGAGTSLMLSRKMILLK